MTTRSRRAAATSAARGSADLAVPADADVPVVGQREPCPCGSGRRYKACHGRKAKANEAAPFVGRPFEGLPGECDWVALREFVPAGTASLRLVAPHDERTVTAATLLPMIAPGLVRADGEVVLGLQTPGGSSDASRDYAAVLERLLAMDHGSVIESVGLPGPGPRLQELLDLSAPLQVEVRDSFDFWLGSLDDSSGIVTASIERANEAISPTARLGGVEAAYWTAVSGREYLRWVMPEAEDAVLDALARLHASGSDTLTEGSRIIGHFRAHGLVVAVWDVVAGTGADALEGPAGEFAGRYAEAVGSTEPLTPAERSARAGIVNRQRTIR